MLFMAKWKARKTFRQALRKWLAVEFGLIKHRGMRRKDSNRFAIIVNLSRGFGRGRLLRLSYKDEVADDASCEKGNKINYLRTWNTIRPNRLRLTLIINCSLHAQHCCTTCQAIMIDSRPISRSFVTGICKWTARKCSRSARSCPTRVSFNGRVIIKGTAQRASGWPTTYHYPSAELPLCY